MLCVSICCVKLLASQSFLTPVFRAIALRLVGNSNALTLQTHVNDSPNTCKQAVSFDVLSEKYRFSSLFIPLMHPVSIVNFSISPFYTCHFIDTFQDKKWQPNEPKTYENNLNMSTFCRYHLLVGASQNHHSKACKHSDSIPMAYCVLASFGEHAETL